MTPTLPAPHAHAADRPDHRVLDLGRLLIGVTIVAIGALFLLDAADVLDAGATIDDWWPAVIVLAGAFTLLERPPSTVRGTLLLLVGAVLLLFTTDVLGDDAWSYLWPAALIVVGAAIGLRWSGGTVPAGAAEDEVVRSTALFSGSNVVSTAREFQGAWLTAVFGGVTLDLRGARPAPGGATVNATAAFGGVDVIVPRGWRVSIHGTPILGGVDDKTDHVPPPADDAPLLHIDAISVFGGVDVKHEKDD